MDPKTNRTDEFLGLFLKAEPRVYAYIRSQIPHRADAEDVLQETAATLWSKFEDFRAGTDFVAWAYQVARFKVQHFRDRQSRRRRLFSQEFVGLVAAQAEEMAAETVDLRSRSKNARIKLKRPYPQTNAIKCYA